MPSSAFSTLRRVPSSKLFVSEPAAYMFGNPADEPNNKHWTNKNWLKSRFHFSFAEYRNARNNQFGVLRVMNDDLVQPARGFGTHGHGDMEIATYIVNGSLTHKDSMGTEESLGRGAIQFMTAGTGVRHSEFNLDKQNPLRFIQMWILPRRSGLKPNYGSASIDVTDRQNKFLHYVSDVANAAVSTPVKVNQDVNIFVSEIDAGHSAAYELNEGRQAYILCVEGTNVATGFGGEGSDEVKLSQHDGAEAVGPLKLNFRPPVDGPNGHVLVVEMEGTDAATAFRGDL